MNRLLVGIVLTALLTSLGTGFKSSVPAVRAAPPVYQGDLIINGNNVTILQDLHYFNGSIIVEENATLILRNSIINFTQETSRQYNITLRNPVNGNPRLYAYASTITTAPSFDILTQLEDNSTANINNSTITSYIDATGNSQLTITNSSTITIMYGYGQSNIEVSNSTVFEWHNYDSPTVHTYNCTIENSIVIGSTTLNCTVNNLQPGLINNWNFQINCTATIPSNGYAPNVTLTDTTVSNWRLAFYGSSNATILNSTLNEVSGLTGTSNIMLNATESHYANAYYSSSLQAENSTISQLQTGTSANAHINNSEINILQAGDSSHVWTNTTTITTIQCHNSATINLLNSTYTNLEVTNNATAYVSWNLDVNVTDTTDQKVPNATVTAYYQNTTLADSTLTDPSGRARLTLKEKMINATGQYTYGDYNVTATYGTWSNQTTIAMTGNEQITLALNLIIPEFTPTLLIAALLTSSALLVAHKKARRPVALASQTDLHRAYRKNQCAQKDFKVNPQTRSVDENPYSR
jgi:hypothetical protein